MADSNRDAVGGDLYSLWRVANITLPTVEKVYVEQAGAAHEIDEPDEQTFGRCHPWWAQLCSELEQSLHTTALTLKEAGGGLNDAVDAFAHVDGDSAKALTGAGEELEEILGDPTLHDPNDELHGDDRPGQVQPPNWNTPQDWHHHD